MPHRRKSDSLRAGLFVMVGVVVFTLAIFLLGQKSALFARTATLFVNFEDVSGLTVGAPVRLAGLEIGTVDDLAFPAAIERREAKVRLVVEAKYMERIRADSEAFIDSNGLLGDKIVNVSMGGPQAAALEDGSTLRARRTTSLESLSSSMDRALGAAASVTESVDRLVQDARTAELRDDLARAAHSLANMLAQVERGPGALHQLLYDPSTGAQLAAMMSDARSTVQVANRAMTRLERVITEVESGDGTLHEIVYGAKGTEALTKLASAANEVDELLRAVRSGEGVLHDLIYRDEGQTLVADVNQLAAKLNAIVSAVDRGEGTVGALIRDPTVYEDLKSVLGGVKRNVLFKALIRYTMESEQLRRVENAPEVHGGASHEADGHRPLSPAAR